MSVCCYFLCVLLAHSLYKTITRRTEIFYIVKKNQSFEKQLCKPLMVWMSPSGMDPIKATLAMFCWAVSWEILDHISSCCTFLGISVFHQHIIKWVKILWVAKAPHFVVNLFQGSRVYIPRVMEKWPLLSNYFTEWFLLWICMFGWVEGKRGRTHLF